MKPVPYVPPSLRPKITTRPHLKIDELKKQNCGNVVETYEMPCLQRIERGFNMTLEIISAPAAPAAPAAMATAAAAATAAPESQKIAVMYVTHIWNAKIDQVARTLLNSCKSRGFDMYVIMGPKVQSVGYELQEKQQRYSALTATQIIQPDESIFKVLRPSLPELTKLYPSGFMSMWASNHYILMWFWSTLGHIYNAVWSIEYDVRWCGSLDTLWNFQPTADYVYSDLSPLHTFGNGHYWTKSITNKWAIKPTRTACKQVFRCSANFLAYLHEKFQLEMNAQDEIALASHAHQGNFLSFSLAPLMSKTWTTAPQFSSKIEQLWLSKSKNDPFELFHPVK